jgi:hypothetical protein
MRPNILLPSILISIILTCCTNKTQTSNITPPIIQETTEVRDTAPETTITRTAPVLPTITNIHPEKTLTNQQQIDRVIELVKTNGGCKYPCFWGMTPSITPYQDAITFYNNLGLTGSDVQQNYYLTDVYLPEAKQRLYIRTYNIDRNYLMGFGINIPNYVGSRYASYLLINEILSEYGDPDEISLAINTGMNSNNRKTTMSYITLIYLDVAILITYSYIAEILDGNYRICFVPDETEFGSIFILLSDHAKKEGYIYNDPFGMVNTMKRFSLLEDTVNMTHEQFMNKIISHKNNTCIETKKGIFWKQPG